MKNTNARNNFKKSLLDFFFLPKISLNLQFTKTKATINGKVFMSLTVKLTNLNIIMFLLSISNLQTTHCGKIIRKTVFHAKTALIIRAIV